MSRNALLGLKRIFFDRIFQRSFWTWRKHPAIIIPTMLGSALQLILQSILTLVLMLLLTGWALAGSLSGFLTEYSNAGLFGVFQDPAFSITLVPVVAVTVVALVLVTVIGGGYVYSAEYGMYVDAWNPDSLPVRSVLENGSRRWRPMAWTLLLSNIITWGPAVIGYLLIIASAASATSTAGLVVLLARVIGLPLTSLITVVLSFVLTPILHLTKTMIYYHAGPSVPEMPFQLSNPIWQDIFRRLPRAAWLKIKMGLYEGFRFVIGPRNLPFHILSTLAFALGIYMGYYVSVNGVAGFFLSLGYRPGHGNSLLAQLPVPALPVLGIDIFLNNWLVSIATALSGLGFAAPSFITIMFNGFILGVLVAPQLSPSLTMFLAAILPHGIIEIPSFVLSGSVGIRLGYAAWKARFRRGPENDEYLSKTLR